MIPKILAKQFYFTTHTMRKNLEGMSEEQCLIAPSGGGSCANWVMGHILAARNGVHRILELEPALSEDLSTRYARGSDPVTAENPGAPTTDLLAALARSQDAIEGAWKGLDKSRLKTTTTLPEPLGEGTLAEHLSLLLFHESYHAGQLGVLRRLAGLDGAIG